MAFTPEDKAATGRCVPLDVNRFQTSLGIRPGPDPRVSIFESHGPQTGGFTESQITETQISDAIFLEIGEIRLY